VEETISTISFIKIKQFTENNKLIIMKKIALALLVIASVSSCTKDKVESSVPMEVKKNIAEVKYPANPSNNRILTYDNQGNLVKIQGTTHYWSYEYLPGKLIIKSYQASTGKLLSTIEHTIDANGRSTGSVYKTESGLVSSNQTFEYDANGYLVKEKTIYVSGEIQENQYSIVGGNAVKEMYYKNGVLMDQTDYQYDESKKAKIYFTMETTEGVKNIHGKGYTNLLSGYKRYDGAGTLMVDRKSTYVLDADGYVVKRSSMDQFTNQSVETEYVYQ
jgi:hypothetical protein